MAAASAGREEEDTLTFVLFCSGALDAKTLRPELDSTQWWGRRDALVRCTSVLWEAPVVREVVLLHADDNALLRTCAAAAGAIPAPTERRLISAWRDVAEGTSVPGVSCERGAWRAARLAAPVDASGGAAANGGGDGAEPSGASELEQLDKREILAFLHANCDAAFLRAHALNSPAPVVLRRCNKAALLRAHAAWRAAQAPSRASARAEPRGAEGSAPSELQLTLEHVLRAALLLHEDYECELPCFGRTEAPERPAEQLRGGGGGGGGSGVPGRAGRAGHTGRKRVRDADGGAAAAPAQPHADDGAGRARAQGGLHLLVCLGAVRDMSAAEEAAVARACARVAVPCAAANLGRTAEFTSKIMAAMAAHATAGVLGPAVRALLRSAAGGGLGARPPNKLPPRPPLPPPATAAPAPQPPQPPARIHLLAGVRFGSAELSEDPGARERMLPLLRLVVNALWRSRLGAAAEPEPCAAGAEAEGVAAARAQQGPAARAPTGTGSPCLPEMALTLCFADGAVLSLRQAELVRALAHAHQAAPSEWQLLRALCAQRDEAAASGGGGGGAAQGKGKRARALAGALAAARLHASSAPLVLELSADADAPALAPRAYQQPCACERRGASAHHGAATVSSGRAQQAHADVATAFELIVRCPEVGQAPSAGAPARQALSDRRWEDALRVALPAAVPRARACLWRRGPAQHSRQQQHTPPPPSPSAALCAAVLQHFQYHGRLEAPVRALCRRAARAAAAVADGGRTS